MLRIAVVLSMLSVVPAYAQQGGYSKENPPPGPNTVNRALKEINNPQPPNPGRVIESRDYQPKREPPPRQSND